MNKSIVLRVTFALVSVGLMMFSLVPNFPTNAQDKETCKDSGWTPIDGSRINLTGTWTGTQNRNCKESASWQYSFTVTVTKEDGVYYGRVFDSEDKTEIVITGSKFKFTRDVRKSSGPDDYKNPYQYWEGTIEMNKDGTIRIYGTWSGAYSYKKGENNLDFMMIKR